MGCMGIWPTAKSGPRDYNRGSETKGLDFQGPRFKGLGSLEAMEACMGKIQASGQ